MTENVRVHPSTSVLPGPIADIGWVTLFPHGPGDSERRRESAPSRPSFDLPTLLEVFDGERAAIAELLDTAIASICVNVEALEAGFAAGDGIVVVEIAHRVKGTSGAIGAHMLIELTSHIERAIIDGAALLAAKLVAELRCAQDAVAADILMYRQTAD